MKKQIPYWVAVVATLAALAFTGYLFGLASYAHADVMVDADALRDAPLASSTVALLIDRAADIYGVNADHLYRTLSCESQDFQNIQSKWPKATGPNGREDSWGIAQIHLPDHPGISREDALDEHWSIGWAAQQFATGHATRWTCYRLLFPSQSTAA